VGCGLVLIVLDWVVKVYGYSKSEISWFRYWFSCDYGNTSQTNLL